MQTEMPAPQVKSRLKAEAGVIEAWLSQALQRKETPAGLLAAMEYSLLAGGKRIRPVLCMVCARLCGLDSQAVLAFACAVECIHTYSLIHDDLPAMDDDDLRRGKPSNHKQFGEATAILAGDGLLTDAFGLMAEAAESCDSHGDIPACRVTRSIALAARAAGSSGMVGGQFLDVQYTARAGISVEELALMQAMKTGAMLRMACETGAVLAGADNGKVAALSVYGAAIGAAFQIVDDILDETGSATMLGKPTGSDAERNKCTYPALMGIEKSRVLAEKKAAEAIAALQDFSGSEAAFLRGLAAYIISRVS